MKPRQYPNRFGREIGPTTGENLSKVPLDEEVKLPAEIRDTIARGEEAFQKVKPSREKVRTRPGAGFVTSVVDANVQNHRNSVLKAKAQQATGKRGQPPMLVRLQALRIFVDRLIAEGVPFGTSRDSKMNKLVGEWLNDLAATSRDRAKSRRKQVSPDAVRSILRQIKELGD
jgi:hypothetical protein